MVPDVPAELAPVVLIRRSRRKAVSCGLVVLAPVWSECRRRSRAENAVDVDRLRDVLQRSSAEAFQTIAIPEPPHRFRTGENLAGPCGGGEPRGEFVATSARGERPTGSRAALEAGGADQGQPGVDPDVDR